MFLRSSTFLYVPHESVVPPIFAEFPDIPPPDLFLCPRIVPHVARRTSHVHVVAFFLYRARGQYALRTVIACDGPVRTLRSRPSTPCMPHTPRPAPRAASFSLFSTECMYIDGMYTTNTRKYPPSVSRNLQSTCLPPDALQPVHSILFIPCDAPPLGSSIPGEASIVCPVLCQKAKGGARPEIAIHMLYANP